VRLIFWLVVLPLAVFSAFFAVNNRDATTLDFDPIPFTVTLPLFVWVLGAILIGLIVGGVAAWMRQGKWRRQARALNRQVQGLEGEMEQVRAQAASIALNGVPEAQTDLHQIQGRPGG
jgi:uncharacterized integral membrane protein